MSPYSIWLFLIDTQDTYSIFGIDVSSSHLISSYSLHTHFSLVLSSTFIGNSGHSLAHIGFACLSSSFSCLWKDSYAAPELEQLKYKDLFAGRIACILARELPTNYLMYSCLWRYGSTIPWSTLACYAYYSSSNEVEIRSSRFEVWLRKQWIWE